MATNAVNTQTVRDIAASSGRGETFVRDVLAQMITAGARPDTIAFGKMFISSALSGDAPSTPAELAEHLMSKRFIDFSVAP